MSMRKEELLAAYDDTWDHRWESFTAALKDVTDEEAQFQHESYLQEEADPAEPPPGTIMWHMIHLAQCYEFYVRVIDSRPIRPNDQPPPQAQTFSEAFEIMRQMREKLRAKIASLSEVELDEKIANGDSIAMFVRMISRHDAWHLGQVIVARRLYRKRPI